MENFLDLAGIWSRPHLLVSFMKIESPLVAKEQSYGSEWNI